MHCPVRGSNPRPRAHKTRAMTNLANGAILQENKAFVAIQGRPGGSSITIDSEWVKILKTSCPGAFTPHRPVACKPCVAFIDGQIKLMAPSWIQTWDEFAKRQFIKPIQDCFDYHSDVVVLAFDNYQHVPKAKAPTQRKRSEKVQNFEFEPNEGLPRCLPENWQQAMRNRIFKNKVVFRVLQMVRAEFESRFLQTNRRRTLILDWHGQPEVVGADVALPDMHETRRGECDIKAFSYLHLGTLLVLSTDGDFIPLSLIQLESVRQGGAKCNVLLHRMAVRVDAGSSHVAPKGKKATRHAYEYVNVALLADFIKITLKSPDPIRLFASFVAMSGCDFAQNLPRIGPKKIWQDRALIPEHKTLNYPVLLVFMTKLYDAMFRKHVSTNIRSLNTIDVTEDDNVGATCVLYTQFLERLRKAPSVAPIIKDSLWSADRFCAHSKNVLWTIQYWTLLDRHPNFLEYGFSMDTAGCVAFQGIN